MKFFIQSTWIDEPDRLLKKYPVLSQFKITIENNKMYITLNTVEEITELIKIVHNPVIIDYDNLFAKGWRIEIYDDWRE